MPTEHSQECIGHPHDLIVGMCVRGDLELSNRLKLPTLWLSSIETVQVVAYHVWAV